MIDSILQKRLNDPSLPTTMQVLYTFALPKSVVPAFKTYQLRKFPYSVVASLLKTVQKDGMYGPVIQYAGQDYQPIYLNGAEFTEQSDTLLWLSFREISSDKIADLLGAGSRLLRYVLIQPVTQPVKEDN